jgi:hypothetical protein
MEASMRIAGACCAETDEEFSVNAYGPLSEDEKAVIKTVKNGSDAEFEEALAEFDKEHGESGETDEGRDDWGEVGEAGDGEAVHLPDVRKPFVQSEAPTGGPVAPEMRRDSDDDAGGSDEGRAVPDELEG